MTKVNKNTKADANNGTDIVCPKCNKTSMVYHFDWTALCCQHCDEEVDLEQWHVKNNS